ncbi:unnamed protein product [Caenorhabditis nigoni]
MVKPKPKSKSNDKNADKSCKSKKFSLMRSIRSLSGRKKAAKKKAENNQNKAPVGSSASVQPMSNSVYFELNKSNKEKSKMRQSKMGGVEASQPQSSDDKTTNPTSQINNDPSKKIPEYENIQTAKSLMLLQNKQLMDTPSNRSKKKNEKNLEALAKRKKNKKSKNLGSVFEDVAGPLSPVNAEPRGAEDKMKWKIDVEGVDLNGDQRMSEVLERLGKLRKKYKFKKCKVLKANEVMKDADEEPTEDEIAMSARILQLVRMDQLINEKFDPEEREILRKYCRSGDQEEKAEEIIEKITMIVLIGVSSKNEFIRTVSIPGQMRMYAVDENKSKLPVMALLMTRCDLLYYAWLKPSTNEEELDPTWKAMAIRKVPMPAVVSAYYPAARGQVQKK